MSEQMNQVILQGYLGGPPNITLFDDGGKKALLSVANTRSWKDKNSGEWQDKTEWIRVVTSQTGIIDKVLPGKAVKGAHVLIMGALRDNSYEDADGVRHKVTEVRIGADDMIQFLPKFAKGEQPDDDAEGVPDAASENVSDEASDGVRDAKSQ